MNESVRFIEEQRLRAWWLWLLVAIPTLVAWGCAISQFVFHRPVGNNPATDAEMWVILALAGFGLPLLMVSVKMTVRVVDDAVIVRVRPFVVRRIPLATIERCEVVEFRPIRDYGGWGIRWNGREWAFVLEGNRGVRLHRTGAGPLVIGSARPEELAGHIRAGSARAGRRET